MPRHEKDEHEHWEHGARRHKFGFALFLLIVGFFWLFRDLGYIQSLPFWPLVLIFFAVFLLLSKV
jgi:apolipoprotein N-acyltransferase